MKPINADEKGCNPISSDCVIWQGPNIECISLCKGDSVSTVVAKLAQELCDLIDIFNLDSYDLSCLNLGSCGPSDFQALMNILIEKICQLEGIDSIETQVSTSSCPDCVVNIADCFYYENELGDQVTTMQLTDYVTAVGNRICILTQSINTIKSTLENHENRIKTLESTPEPTLELPKITPISVTDNPKIAQEIDVVLAALEIEFCELVGATGGPVDIFNAVSKQCNSIVDDDRLVGSGTMGNITGWSSEVNNLADAINNMWLTICDMRAAIKNIQANCCPSVCNDVNIQVNASLEGTNTLKLYFTGIAAGFTQCDPSGTVFTISDSNGNTITDTINVISNLNNTTGVSIDLTGTPVNSSLDLTITSTLCLENTEGSQCQSILSTYLTNTANCPAINLTPGETTVAYTFGWTGSTASFQAELYDATGTALIQSQTVGVGGPGTINGIFNSLTGGTTYKVRLKITIDGNETVCPFVPTTTIAPPCIPPTGLVAELNIT